jgi:ribose transport system substrate-binding protein
MLRRAGSCRNWGIGLALLLAGCGAGTQPDAATTTADGDSGSARYRIAVIPKGTTHDFWLSVHHGAEQAAEELGNVEILWDGPPSERDKDAQIKLVESFLLKQVDGVCLAPIDRDALVPVVRRCGQKEIPVVIFDSGLSDPDSYISYVATDNYKGGTMAGERLVELLAGKGNVIMLPYQEGSESTEQRERGFLDVIARHPDVNVLSDDQRVGSDAEEALRISSSLLVQYGDQVDGIFTVCEPLNKGMLKALEDKDMAGQVKFVGFDSDPRFVEALKGEKMHGIILQDPVNMGYTAVKTMVAHLEGEDVSGEISTGEALATPENMDQPRMSQLLHPPKFGHE